MLFKVVFLVFENIDMPVLRQTMELLIAIYTEITRIVVNLIDLVNPLVGGLFLPLGDSYLDVPIFIAASRHN